MNVEPQSARYQLLTTANGLRAVIPARRSWFTILFFTVWLGGWTLGEISVALEIFNPSSHARSVFLGFWLVGWTLAGGAVLSSILWQLAGREVITGNGDTLEYRVEAFGVGRSRVYRLDNVKDLRATEYSPSHFGNQRAAFPPIYGSRVGSVAFDYGARTIRFAPSLEEAEAKLLVREFALQFPHMRGDR